MPPSKRAEEMVAAAGAADAADEEWLGYRLRLLRKSKQMSLKELGVKSALSVAMLSRIERGDASPSIRSLRQIARAMDVPISVFFSDSEEASFDSSISRSSERRVLNLFDKGMTKAITTPRDSGQIEMMLIQLSPGGSSGEEAYTHPGEEAGLVIKGVLELWIGDECHILHEGDCFHFSSETPHRFKNRSRFQTEVVWVVTPPYWSTEVTPTAEV